MNTKTSPKEPQAMPPDDWAPAEAPSPVFLRE